jgi:hypothetical protein
LSTVGAAQVLRLTPLIGGADNTAMRDRDDCHRWGPAAAALVLLIVPALYPLSVGPLSVGPAIVVFDVLGQPQQLGQALSVIYWPLEHLSEPFYGAIKRYAEL